MKSTLQSKALALTLLGALSGPAPGLSTDKDQPLDLEADSAEIDEAKAERLEAVGKPARFQQLADDSPEPVKARAQRMEYRFDSEELLLMGDAVVLQGKDTFKSDRITYDRVRSVVKGGAAAKGKERVRITVDPKAREKARDDKKPATGADRKTPAPEKKPPATDKKKPN